jgi:hypothetical protein
MNKWINNLNKKFLGVQNPFSKKRVAPATQDATQPADQIRVGEKVCFFCMFLQGIIKKGSGRRRHNIKKWRLL